MIVTIIGLWVVSILAYLFVGVSVEEKEEILPAMLLILLIITAVIVGLMRPE